MSAARNDWKNRKGIVYSTNSDFEYSGHDEILPKSLPPSQQTLKVTLDKSGRAGKQVTLISGFSGPAEDLEKLAKLVKTGCGVGGSSKHGTILVQGDLREKVIKLLHLAGYKARLVG